jgi:hypothetical protein
MALARLILLAVPKTSVTTRRRVEGGAVDIPEAEAFRHGSQFRRAVEN